MAVYKLKNKILKYAWGSLSAMPELLGYLNPDNEPLAELWMGAHPKSPSEIVGPDGRETALNEYLSASPEAVLGAGLSKRFNGRLPFLFKVLAAGSPLSIQAHPNLEQARKGFERENSEGIAIDAFNRNYKDDNHKPEIICALSVYHTMRGFRSAQAIAANFRMIMIPELEEVIGLLENAAEIFEVSAALKMFFTVLMQLGNAPKAVLIEKAITAGDTLSEFRWIKRFSELYPGDIGIVSPLYLNVVTLQSGEAMYLAAGELHAYLEGIGIELMANSDNVLRGGLTPKHVDVPELLATLSFNPCEPEILTPVKITENESAYITEAPEFYLSRIELAGEEYLLPKVYGPELPSIFICLKGEVEITDLAEPEKASVITARGETAFADYGTMLRLKGRGVLYRASVPILK